MSTICHKSVISSDPEVDHTKSKPNSGALHTYVDLALKSVAAPAPRVGVSHVFLMSYIAKSLFFQALSLKLRTLFSFLMIELKILTAIARWHQEQGQHIVPFLVLVWCLCFFYSITAICIATCLCMYKCNRLYFSLASRKVKGSVSKSLQTSQS